MVKDNRTEHILERKLLGFALAVIGILLFVVVVFIAVTMVKEAVQDIFNQLNEALKM